MQDESQRMQSNMMSQCVHPLQQLNLNDPTALAFTQGKMFKRDNGRHCDYYNMKGHKRENCYKLVGYPPKGTKKKGFDRPHTYGNNQNFGHTRGPIMHNANLVEGATSGNSTVQLPVFTPK